MAGKTLIIQIPCFDEGDTLGITLAALPRSVPGFARVDWMVIDDGSTDGTLAVAKAAGVDYIVRLGRNQGLARAFAAGLEAAVRAGADVIVNTDADNQYQADDIPKLTAPILAGEADLVIGARPIVDTPHFSRTKKALQLLGSMIVRMASRTTVVDAPSGFRALSREAALRLHVHGDYTYTLETIIAGGRKNMAVTSVPIRTNPELRPSRLVRSLPDYAFRSAVTILRSFATYKPLRFFVGVGLLLFAGGFALGLRYVYFAALGEGEGHVQSVILCALLIGMGVFTGLIGILADLIAVDRRLLAKLLTPQQADRVESAAPRAPTRPRAISRPGRRRHLELSMSWPTDAGPVVAGNLYPKYTTRNPVARLLVANFITALRRLVRRTGAREIHEVGCGAGHLSLRLAAEGWQVRGSDLSPAAIREASGRARACGLAIPFQVADLYELEPARDGAPLVLCCEVLEDVPDPERALAVLAALARPHLIVSVPREPLWRVLNLARGKYWRDLGKTPGHLQHWSTLAFLDLLQDHLEVLELRTPLPWTMALCRTR